MMVEGGQGNTQGVEGRLEGPLKDMRTEINGGSGKEGNYEVRLRMNNIQTEHILLHIF